LNALRPAIAILFTFISVISFSQARQITQKLKLPGKVFSENEKTPLPYANIYNRSTEKGTITNFDGLFIIEINSLSDTLVISYTGYQKKIITASEIKKNPDIFLRYSITLLEEVTVLADDSFLYDMVLSCRKKTLPYKKISKTYFSLNTFIENKQVEMVEAYHNGIFSGYTIEELKMKNGRLAFAQHDDNTFLSTETSKALYFLKLFEKNEYLPENPFGLNKKLLRKNYRLIFSNKYKDEKQNTIYCMDFIPKDSSGKYFNGTVWIDSLHKNILKINLQIENATTHPFLPLWRDDVLKQVDMNITETFVPFGNDLYFEHIDFSYNIRYKNRKGREYVIQTHAILHAYDYKNEFILPESGAQDYYLSDYRKIEAAPYNSFFWNYNDELSVPERKNKNNLFFSSPQLMHYTGKTKTFTHDPYNRGFFEAPFIRWNGDRICFIYQPKDSIKNIAKNESFVTAPANLYKLKVHLYMDINKYKDSLHVLTATIFDPYESYYKYPIDSITNCFLNIYFDISEIQRNEFENEIQKKNISIEEINVLYAERKKKLESLSNEFFKEVERGKNKKELLKWNNYVKEKLGIDNFEVFRLYEK